jgi:hypothetical protein
MIRFTASHLAAANEGMSRDAAAALIQYLRQANLVTNVGALARGPGERGRGEGLYEGDAKTINAHLSALKIA